MKVLVIGAGGREHALSWALKKSPQITELVCAPGNGGMETLARCVPVNLKDLDDLLRVVAAEHPDLTVIGPELPLSLGLADELKRRGLRVFGPTRAAAQLETSKSFAKRFMQRYKIPTANYVVSATAKEALDALHRFHLPAVVKADGLAAGKGVLICTSKAEAEQAINDLFSGKLLGEPAQTVIIEEFLTGEELSFLLLADGKHVTPLVPSQDHKRLGEGDTGPNTGGMGVYSTDEMLDAKMRDWLLHHVAQPTIDGMAAEEMPFSGVLYCGLMMTARGPMVLEFNARFGDPETQAIVARLDSDLLDALLACAEGRLSDTQLRWKPGASACVVAASGGYPGSYTKGFKITGIEEAESLPGVTVFHAGTARVGGETRTSGGRVLGVTAAAGSLEEALRRAYEGMAKIHFDNMFFRRDIGHRALKKRN